jgi:hypothetical protein
MKMLRGLLHAIPTDPSLLHNKISKISIIVETKNKTVKREHRLREFENRVLRRIRYLDRGRMKWLEGGENCVMRSFVIFTLCQV